MGKFASLRAFAVLYSRGVDFTGHAMASTSVHATPKLKLARTAARGAAFE